MSSSSLNMHREERIFQAEQGKVHGALREQERAPFTGNDSEDAQGTQALRCTDFLKMLSYSRSSVKQNLVAHVLYPNCKCGIAFRLLVNSRKSSV